MFHGAVETVNEWLVQLPFVWGDWKMTWACPEPDALEVVVDPPAAPPAEDVVVSGTDVVLPDPDAGPEPEGGGRR